MKFYGTKSFACKYTSSSWLETLNAVLDQCSLRLLVEILHENLVQEVMFLVYQKGDYSHSTLHQDIYTLLHSTSLYAMMVLDSMCSTTMLTNVIIYLQK